MVIFVVDSTMIDNHGRYKDLAAKRALKKLANHPINRDKKILVLANKQDCSEARPVDEIAQELDLESVGRTSSITIPVLGVSAKTGLNCDKVLEWIADSVMT